MSVFEQCLPYRELGLDRDLTCEVLDDDEDLLHQLSAQLDLPAFMETELPSLPTSRQASPLPPLEGLECGLLENCLDQVEAGLSYPDSGYSDSVKSEPASPASSSQDPSPPLSPVLQSITVVPQLSQPAKLPIPKLSRPAPAPAPLLLYCNQPNTPGPQPGQIIVKTEPTHTAGLLGPAGYCSPLVSALPTVPTPHSNAEDLRNLKRQQRMIKNRESACISRKKKKEYLTQLEDQIRNLSQENSALRNENENLKEKVRELQREKVAWTERLLSSPGPRRTTALLAIVLMVSLPLTPYSPLSPLGSPGPGPGPAAPVREAGRSLLWVKEPELEAGQEEEGFLANLTRPQCGGTNLNQTESSRLESDLRGWFSVAPTAPPPRRPDTKRKPTRSPRRKQRSYPLAPVIRSPLNSITGSLYHLLAQEAAGQEGNSVSLYSGSRPHSRTFASFFQAIERREDTFYVVSFSGDHLLVPATNHSKTSRPLMSLLLPAVVSSGGQNSEPDTIAMMKIDCQVINTQMVHIMKDAIPVHLSDSLKRNTSSSREEGETNDTLYTQQLRNTLRKEKTSKKEDNRTLDTEKEEGESEEFSRDIKLKRRRGFTGH